MRVTFELSKQDLAHLRRILRKARRAVKDADDEEIIDGARRVMADVAASDAPSFVRKRVDRLQSLIGMLGDEDWQAGGQERLRILEALAYLGDPEDMIPDHIPGLGFLDDAIMIELVLRSLRHDIEAYEDFCNYRDAAERRLLPARLAARRDRLKQRAKRRKSRDKQTGL